MLLIRNWVRASQRFKAMMVLSWPLAYSTSDFCAVLEKWVDFEEITWTCHGAEELSALSCYWEGLKEGLSLMGTELLRIKLP